MAACKHNSNLSNTFSRRVSVAQCVGAIASSPTPWSLRDDLLNFIHGVKPDNAVSSYLLPDIQVRMAKVRREGSRGAACRRNASFPGTGVVACAC